MTTKFHGPWSVLDLNWGWQVIEEGRVPRVVAIFQTVHGATRAEAESHVASHACERCPTQRCRAFVKRENATRLCGAPAFIRRGGGWFCLGHRA